MVAAKCIVYTFSVFNRTTTSEKGEIALGRTTTETTIGATAGLVMSTIFGGIPAMAARDLRYT